MITNNITMNIIKNAIRFTNSGEIKMIVKPLMNNGIRISIKDSGQGFSTERLRQNFLIGGREINKCM